MIKLSDYIAKRLKECYGIKHFFMVSGGGAMHLNDSLGREIPYICNHHEQGCAIAAEGYARVNQELAVVNVTTGPGGLNCLNGVFGQWTDSVPVLYISGQVKYTTTLASCPQIPLRQLGDQEVDIVSVVGPLTKYAKMVTEPEEIKYHLDRAIYEATTGRFGPVWLDIPMNVQSALIDENNLKEFIPPSKPVYDFKIEEVLLKLEQAARPLVVAGHGIRLSKQEENFQALVKKLNIPVVTTFNGLDAIASDNENFVGRIGTVGQRSGNFALQNADVILFLGTRNNIRQVSYNWENFAKNAFKIVVDIDAAELEKPLVKADLKVHADLKEFLPALLNSAKPLSRPDWLNWARGVFEKYSFDNTPEYRQKGPAINTYYFVHKLTKLAGENDIIVGANGSACICMHQVAAIKKGQRAFYNSGDASMGYDLPAALGAALAAPDRNTICLSGDGSIMMNIQELQTIKHYKIPMKIFLINNSGYISIIQTQNNFFGGHLTGASAASGVTMPDFCKVANAFGIKTVRIEDSSKMTETIKEVLASKELVLCEVMVEKDYIFTPKLSARQKEDGTMVSPGLEDMYPFLDRKELEENMVK